MTLTIDAIYENGVFKPKHPVALAEGTEIQLILNTSGDADAHPLDDVIGICTDDPLEAVIGICDDGPDISLAARHDEFIYGLKHDAKAKP